MGGALRFVVQRSPFCGAMVTKKKANTDAPTVAEINPDISADGAGSWWSSTTNCPENVLVRPGSAPVTTERKEKRAVLNQSRLCGHNNTSIVLVSVVKVCLFVYLLLHICTPSLFIKTLNRTSF